MKRVLLTGLSGTRKSSVLARLAELGHRTVDTDEDDLTTEVRSTTGTTERQLAAPASVVVERLTTRTNNAYGKAPEEMVEAVLRKAATLELNATAPLEAIVEAIGRDYVVPQSISQSRGNSAVRL
jgi:predicted ATPase